MITAVGGEVYAFTATAVKGWARVAIEQAAVPESGGAFRLPRARVVPLAAGPAAYAAAMDRYLTAAGISKGSARVYRISLANWCWMLAGERTPTGPDRRGAKPPALELAALDDPVLPEVLAELAAAPARTRWTPTR
jgi:integrase/recombinase XerD